MRKTTRLLAAIGISLAVLSGHAAPVQPTVIEIQSVDIYGEAISLAKYVNSEGKVCQQYVRSISTVQTANGKQSSVKLADFCEVPNGPAASHQSSAGMLKNVLVPSDA